MEYIILDVLEENTDKTFQMLIRSSDVISAYEDTDDQRIVQFYAYERLEKDPEENIRSTICDIPVKNTMLDIFRQLKDD